MLDKQEQHRLEQVADGVAKDERESHDGGGEGGKSGQDVDSPGGQTA
jgi:hypothetical protein